MKLVFDRGKGRILKKKLSDTSKEEIECMSTTKRECLQFLNSSISPDHQSNVSASWYNGGLETGLTLVIDKAEGVRVKHSYSLLTVLPRHSAIAQISNKCVKLLINSCDA